MKKLIVVITVLLSTSNVIFAQKSDYQLVEETVSFYLDGGTNNDYETLKKAFHENATMKFNRKGEYVEVNALDFFKKVIKPGPKQNRKTHIVYINITGDVASAKLQIDYENFSFIDYMNLIKIDNQWKVVSKIFFRK
ncbi:nuclear transport factor 2 family protein [Tenacibaculum agarivorans]|uniref:nuclear transport factor 2 family protein n=1 Tax=Tenacibaculum agarivorans TaxID=1908389 RepID=UPI00094BA186|nr:nuclear transport factor 2 family protein [Tenacibaculum agarivorans]